MAGRIKKMAKEVAKTAIASVVPGGPVVKAALDIKGASGKIACRKKGGKWVKGKCVSAKLKKAAKALKSAPIPKK